MGGRMDGRMDMLGAGGFGNFVWKLGVSEWVPLRSEDEGA